MREIEADILIVGGGLGGVAAAIAAAHYGKHVVLTEETDWIGGQLTAQIVPPDEHPWIETHGATRCYRTFRHLVRKYYNDFYPLTGEARSEEYFNPGVANVSRIAHEPRVALAVLNAMLAFHISRADVFG